MDKRIKSPAVIEVQDPQTKALATVKDYGKKKKSVEYVVEKFNVPETLNHLHTMMKDVVKKEVTPESVQAACACVEKMTELMNTTVKVAKFVQD